MVLNSMVAPANTPNWVMRGFRLIISKQKLVFK